MTIIQPDQLSDREKLDYVFETCVKLNKMVDELANNPMIASMGMIK